MGTNYYYVANECNHCQRHDLIHIGKQSFGWRFLLSGYSGKYDLSDMLKSIGKNRIVDEYGNEITLQQLITIIQDNRYKKFHMNTFHKDLYDVLNEDFS